MIVLLLLILMIAVYCVCNISTFYPRSIRGGGGDEDRFSVIFKRINPPIDTKALVYNNSPDRFNYQLIRRRINIAIAYYRTVVVEPKKQLGVDKVIATLESLKSYPNEDLPRSIVTYHNNRLAIIVFALTVFNNIRSIMTPNTSFSLYISNILNDIDYSRTDRSVWRELLLAQITHFKNILISDPNGDSIRNIIEGMDEPLPDTSAMVSGLRNDFYRIRNSKPFYLKNGEEIKREDYKRLLQRAKQVGIDLKRNNATREQEDQYQTIRKRIESSLSTD